MRRKINVCGIFSTWYWHKSLRRILCSNMFRTCYNFVSGLKSATLHRAWLSGYEPPRESVLFLYFILNTSCADLVPNRYRRDLLLVKSFYEACLVGYLCQNCGTLSKLWADLFVTHPMGTGISIFKHGE